jgi:gliding motility-associated-like protein
MISSSRQFSAVFFFLLLSGNSYIFSQKCDSSFFASSITGDHNEGISIKTFCTNQQNEIISTGSFAYGNFFSRAWVSKSTSKGNIIWSRQYSNPKFDNIEFNSILSQPDGSSLVTGTLFKLDATTRVDINDIVFLKLDKFGKIVWSKAIDSHHSVSRNSYYMDRIIQTKNGDFIMSIVVVKDDQSIKYYGSVIVLRFTINGDIIWTKQISSTNYMMGNYGFSLSNTEFSSFSQLPSGNIVFGSVIDDYDYTTGNITKEGYYFSELDFNTGNRVWDNSYAIPSSSIGPLKGVQKITLLPNGNLSFFADIFQQPAVSRFNRRAVNIITDAKGDLKKAISYYNSNTNADCDLAAVISTGNNGDQQILMNEDILKTGVLFTCDIDGNLITQTGFKGPKGAIGPLAFALFNAKQGYYFASTDRSINSIHLFNADASGSLTCLNKDVNIISESSTNLFTKESANVSIDNIVTGDFLDGGIVSQNYNMHSVTDCNVVTCCNDIIDEPLVYGLCEESSVTLPDNTIVSDTGTYYATYKTALGCDSIALYKVVASEATASLRVTQDTCLNSSGFVTLNASGDFDTFYWMNIPTNQSSFTVNNPGTYYVKATNSCGSKTDSVHVYETCNFDVFIPNAFTPNKDGINELFRIPQNLNKLISFHVYNRFGQLIFETQDAATGWDGTFKNKPQPVGLYVYYIEMESFTGKQIKKRGTVTLLR